ncbi:MAG: bifunctional 3-(3-hydroxy-phenyl)propionate/3-hydroxycinnamic acid hydroxylase [Pseudomonadota bacterium]
MNGMNTEYDVLVVGLGPVGATISALLGDAGLAVRAIEKDREIYKQPRAIAMDFEVIRQLGMIGVADDILATSVASEGYQFVNRNRDILVSLTRPSHNASTGYPHTNLFHQPSLEAAIRRELGLLESVELSLGCTLVSFSQSPSGVVATVHGESGEEVIRAKYLVACDGGRSTVRRALGIEMYDMGFDEPWMVVDAKLKAPLEKISYMPMQLCDPRRPTTSVPSGRGRHRWEFMLRPDDDREQVTQEETLRSWIADWVDPDLVEIERRAIYEFHGVIADRWRHGRCLLIGDAAHQMPPFLGQGLCSGIRDAFNLAWKLIAVLRQEAPEALLDSLQPEREEHVAAITRNAIAMGKIVCIADEEAAAKRDREMMAERAAGKVPKIPTIPPIATGVLASAGGGAVMPEPRVQTERGSVRLDALAGYAPVLIVRDAASLDVEVIGDITALGFAAEKNTLFSSAVGAASIPSVIDESGDLETMMAGAEALLAKPDRVVFGTGSVADLSKQWSAYRSGKATPGATRAA